MEEQNITLIEVREIPIELHKLLKFATLVQSGGEAKSVIAEGLVKVNGAVEKQRGKKLVSGDIIEFNNRKFRVALKNNPSIS